MEIVNLESFKQTLQKKFDVACFVDLVELEHTPSSTLYKILSPHLKTSYQDNYRFIFYNSAPVKTNTLEHVSHMINYLDISPYFVEVYTNQSHTANFFESLSEPIKIRWVNLYNHNVLDNNVIPLFNTNRKMCAHAWAGLHVWTDGTSGICCEYQGIISDEHGNPYNIKEHSIETIVSSQYMNDIRNQMRNGIDPIGCATCTKREQLGTSSRRTLAPYRLENIWGLINWESNDISNNLCYVGGHLGNLCNLKCRICGPEFSSTIAAEELSTVPKDQIKQHPAGQWLESTSWAKKKNEFWNSLKQRADQIKTFEFLGGEPLMLPQNLEFMQYLIDQGHSKNCIFDITTNGTVYPDIFDQASSFKRLVVTISIDNLESKFEYERKGANWQLLLSNLKKFQQARNKSSNLKLGVCITANIQNVLYLPELIEWINSEQFDHYYINILNQPEYLNIQNLTPNAQSLVLNKLSTWKFDKLAQEKIQPILQLLKQSGCSDGKTFVIKFQQKDQLRKENFLETHSEIAKAMGYDQIL